jgi:A/G-specific adenine glycosylase
VHERIEMLALSETPDTRRSRAAGDTLTPMRRRERPAADAAKAHAGPDPDRALDIQRRLLSWFAAHKRDLPWRADRDPYRVWISEAMLQQTRVETVRPYYERFMARFPTLEVLANAPIEDVLAAWSGLGYYRRARTLQAAARAIVAEHGGAFPRDRESLLALPGIGPYTAGAIASIAFDAPEPLLDGNVARVFCRLFARDGDPTSAGLRAELWQLARDLLPRKESCGDWNQALMELGALVCTPRDPGCDACPLRAHCRAAEQGRASELPRPRARRPMIHVELSIAAVVDGDRWLLERRPRSGRMAELWQLPTLERTRAGLFPTSWPAGVEIHVDAELGAVRHTITHHRIRAVVTRARLAADSPPHESFTWFARRDVDALALTGMARKVFRAPFLAILLAPAPARRAAPVNRERRRREPSNALQND